MRCVFITIVSGNEGVAGFNVTSGLPPVFSDAGVAASIALGITGETARTPGSGLGSTDAVTGVATIVRGVVAVTRVPIQFFAPKTNPASAATVRIE